MSKTNVLSEHDFGQLDRFLQEKPNATTLSIESMIMLANNKTMRWLSQKSADERGAILQAALALAPKHQQLAKARKQASQEYRQQHLAALREKRARQAELHAQRVQQVTAALMPYSGLWVTGKSLTINLSTYSTAQQRKAIQAQLRFRKHCMKQSGSKELFAFSKNKTPLTIEQLRSNLL